ncbi:hypothetical protein MUK42_29061 [Musa troglodytarum]|uniref:Uncharacterized protein n=1 Tax=Musa troglodytarum TaxID=320322 RepID=A0A9E7FG31_9LILI|nr:hypothetical protein MUK42_29061 [Musa troglodytarum]
MAFVPKKPPSSSSDENQIMEVARSPVSNSLYLKGPNAAGGAERRSLDKDVVLSRIRHRKRVSQLETVLQSHLRSQPAMQKDGEPSRWLDDAFSYP